MLKFVLLFALVGVAIGAKLDAKSNGVQDVTTSRPGYTDSGLLDCSVLENGSHNVHPYDCTRFIQCDNGRAQDMPCAVCGTSSLCLGRTYLEYDGSAPSCVWPADSTCTNHPPTTTEASEPSTLEDTETTTLDDAETTTVADADESTTEESAEETTEAPTTPPPSGSNCDATNCTISLTCRDYTFCERIDKTEDPDLVKEGQLVTVECAPGTWPVGSATENSGGDYVVGACLPWQDVPEERQQQIIRECTEPLCELIAVGGPCTTNFQYRSNDGTLSSVKTCPSGTIVDIPKRGCVQGSC